MPTKINYGKLFVIGDDGNYMPIGDDIEDLSVDLNSNMPIKTDKMWCTYEGQDVITFSCPLGVRKKHRAISVGQAFQYLCGHSNNWLKMHGYPMVRSIPLRGKRTRSKKKKA